MSENLTKMCRIKDPDKIYPESRYPAVKKSTGSLFSDPASATPSLTAFNVMAKCMENGWQKCSNTIMD
jgi:hypothetical protein